MTTSLVKVENLHRSFGTVRAVDDVSFSMHSGEIIGFIGANGAGKTTTMRIIATLDTAERGTVLYRGKDTRDHQHEVRRIIGWMPDHFTPYNAMTTRDYLKFFARAYGFTGREQIMRVEEVADFTGVKSFMDMPARKVSKGMTQRLCLARMLLSDPEVLLLDEPAAGLDPAARLELKNLMRVLADEGKTILISSHILNELESFSDRLLFINQGKIIFSGNPSELRREIQGRSSFFLELAADTVTDQTAVIMLRLKEFLLCHGEIADVSIQAKSLTFECPAISDSEIAALLKLLINEGFPLLQFRRQEQQLENAFVEILARDTKRGEHEMV
ncbi:MAG: ABC transporter ATP-binding protein [bacterium]|nr:ABC transporter ATP-binding protein [bacterium]